MQGHQRVGEIQFELRPCLLQDVHHGHVGARRDALEHAGDERAVAAVLSDRVLWWAGRRFQRAPDTDALAARDSFLAVRDSFLAVRDFCEPGIDRSEAFWVHQAGVRHGGADQASIEHPHADTLAGVVLPLRRSRPAQGPARSGHRLVRRAENPVAADRHDVVGDRDVTIVALPPPHVVEACHQVWRPHVGAERLPHSQHLHARSRARVPGFAERLELWVCVIHHEADVVAAAECGAALDHEVRHEAKAFAVGMMPGRLERDGGVVIVERSDHRFEL